MSGDERMVVGHRIEGINHVLRNRDETATITQQSGSTAQSSEPSVPAPEITARGSSLTAHGPRAFRIFLIHHTHWDREWWATFQDFRVRLVELIDDLLETLDRDPEFRTFLLDSQTIVLRDYLEIRPQNRERLAARIREGRIECGPWYILPDEFLVSAEAHVRNLLMGRRIARDLDIPLLNVGYLPDTFGHIGQMPQILRGFGIDNAFMWRGRGGDPETTKQEFLWQAPDSEGPGAGSEVLTHWFPSGYYQMPFLHFGNPDRPYEDKLGRIFHAMEEWGERATTDVLLMPYGGDHRPIDRDLAAKIREANEAIASLGEVRWATVEEYLAAVREMEPELEGVRGELRSFGPFNPHILPGVLSARIHLKVANFWGQTWLERFAEPMSALAWVHGRRYDEGLLGSEIPFHVQYVGGSLPMVDTWRYTEIGFVADKVPGLGYRAYRLARRDTPLNSKQVFFTSIQPTARLKGSERVTDLAIGHNALENSHLHVQVDTRTGTLTVTDKASGETYSGLNDFDDGGDTGDTYNYSAPLSDMVLRSSESARVHVSVAEAGYARATLRIDLDWLLPAGLADDRLSRSSTSVETRLSTFVTLTAGSRRVDICTEWENRTEDHRLRALLPLGSHVDVSHAQGHFEIVHRPVSVLDPGRGWEEIHVSDMPQQGWVSVDDGRRGLMVANHGLPEYRVLDDDKGTIAITLLRAVGWLSREDTLGRIGGAGPQTPTPEAQCLGKNRVSYAIIPHVGNWLTSHAYLTAEEFLAPLYGSATGAHHGEAQWSAGLLQLTGDHTLIVSTCKKAEGSDALLLRAWNVAGTPTEARVRLSVPPLEVRLVDLKEEPVRGGALPIAPDGTFALPAGPHSIVTVAIWF